MDAGTFRRRIVWRPKPLRWTREHRRRPPCRNNWQPNRAAGSRRGEATPGALRRQETISSVTQAVRGHVNAKRYTEALKLVEGALGQYPGDEILQKVGAAVQEARRRYVAELEAERRQAIERQRQAEEQLRLLEAESGESRLEEKPSPAQTPAPPDRPSVGRTPPSARDPLVAPLPSPPTRTPDRTPARLAPPQSRPGRRTIILAAPAFLHSSSSSCSGRTPKRFSNRS